MLTKNELLNFAKENIANKFDSILDNKVSMVDQGGYLISRLERISRLCWGLTGVYYCGAKIASNRGDKEVEINDFINTSLLDIISQNIPVSLDENNFAFQAVTELSAYLLCAYINKESFSSITINT